jgi:hypothetical protein
MKKKIMVMFCSLLLATSVLGFAQEKKLQHNLSEYEQASENAKIKKSLNVYNSRANKIIRAKELAEKKAEEEKKKVDDAQYKSEGQVNVKF